VLSLVLKYARRVGDHGIFDDGYREGLSHYLFLALRVKIGALEK
jgi:hypothetical protein